MRFGDRFSVNARKLSIYLRFSRRFFELLNKLPLKHEVKSFYVTKKEKETRLFTLSNGLKRQFVETNL